MAEPDLADGSMEVFLSLFPVLKFYLEKMIF